MLVYLWITFSLSNSHSKMIKIVIHLLQMHKRDTVGSQLSELRLSEHSIIWTPKVTVLLEYFSIDVCSIRVNDCSIRVFEQSTVYKSMGFSYPNKFEHFCLTLGVRIIENPLYFGTCTQGHLVHLFEYLYLH